MWKNIRLYSFSSIMVLLKYVHLIITFTVVLVGGGGATTTDDLLPYDDSLAWNDPPQLESTVDWTALPDLIPPDSNIFSLSSSDPFSIINLGFLGGEEEEEDAGEGSSNTDLLAGNQQPNECLVPIPPVGKERRRRHHLLLLGRDSEVCNGNGGNGNGNRNGNGIGANNGHSKPQPPPPETKAPSLEATVTAFDQANCPQQRPWFICSSKVISDSWRMLPSSWVLQRSTRGT